MSEAYRSRRPKTSRILPQSFDLDDTTALGGLNHLSRFVRERGVDRMLAQRFRSVKARWASHPLDRVLRVMLDAHFAGIERIYHFADLETEPLLRVLHGVDRLPDFTTLYRDLLRFVSPDLLR